MENRDKIAIKEASDLHPEYFKNSFLSQEQTETIFLNKQPTWTDRPRLERDPTPRHQRKGAKTGEEQPYTHQIVNIERLVLQSMDTV